MNFENHSRWFERDDLPTSISRVPAACFLTALLLDSVDGLDTLPTGCVSAWPLSNRRSIKHADTRFHFSNLS